MESIVLPDKVVLRLVDSEGNILRICNVLFFVHTFAARKNDFNLGPFVTDQNGVAAITKRDLLAEAAAHYDSGLMDYCDIGTCKPEVRIEAMDAAAVEKALETRTSLWKTLLAGESQRWKSIEELRDVYRTATNKSVRVEPIKSRWDGKATEYEYAVVAHPR